MKKIIALFLAALLIFGSSFVVFAEVPPLEGMTETMDHSNWYGIGVLQTITDGLVSNASESQVSYNTYSNTKEILVTGAGTSGQQVAAFFYNGYTLIPQYTSGQSFNASFHIQTGGSFNLPTDPVYLLVCDQNYAEYFFKEVVLHSPVITWLETIQDMQAEGELQHDVVLGNWFAWKKVDSIWTNMGRTVDINFTVPEGTSELYICVVGGRYQPGNFLFSLGDITLSPVGSTYDLWQGILADQRDQVFQEDVISEFDAILEQDSQFYDDQREANEQASQFYDDVIGDDSGEDDEGSGLLGILKFLKNIPGWIADKIIGLFVPDQDAFDDLFDRLDELFQRKFGIIWQAGSLAVRFISRLWAFDPGTSSDPTDYDLKFPAAEVEIDVHSDGSVDFNSGSGSIFPLIPDSGDGYYHVDLSFFEDGTGATIYSIYRAFVTCILILGFVWLCERKFKAIFGGDDG